MFEDFKPTLKILLRFLLVYLVLLGVYQFYLNTQEGLDGLSIHIANQCTLIQNNIGYPSQAVPQLEHNTLWYYVGGEYVSRMVEGCNAVSVIILFIAFIFAFYRGFKTFIFVFAGVIFLYIINILRIVGINVVLLEYPSYGKAAHDYIFPAIIYGSVVVLWIIWIKFFVLKDEVQR
ncbi:exosortase family protein XrtF [Riemerella anatipestifer]|uniref:exosortase family protein XrtF n=1 Tax=Riemerella anatipestifer TaxID=34085 RepID=UPI0007ED334F|nr:exosortase family protein XrtF [Riemerella anatipestifer]AZZ58625.1 exosortase family protein XrtF [Riemerella anatipestifer]MBT0551116.1 exosortase family protein XrtF [Riemerella anatipestifer]MBT0553731.1 exosortase family protein XrtF [Riemerella anatipestifer]MCE3023926.1 exosortase family protein XrtF [Riemerella anatipestifer]MCO7318843.1 exosortase family protein XrtF [Riemerella anatipestifer]